MNIAVPTATSIKRVAFSTFTDAEIQRLSVIQVTTEKIFDNLQHPTYGGLYDPAMGPLIRGALCTTCHLDERFCPGHFGHIALPRPCYHPLFFPQLFNLLRGMCLYCHKFRLAKAEVHKYVCQLILLDKGLLLEAQEFSEINFRQTRFRSSKESGSDEETNDFKDDSVGVDILLDRRRKWVTSKIRRAATSAGRAHVNDAAVSNARRLLIKSFLAHIISRKRCDNCTAFSPSFKKDGYAKIFEVPLSEKQKTQMDLLGRSRTDILVLPQQDFDMQEKKHQAEQAQSDAESAVLTESEDEMISFEAKERSSTKRKHSKITRYVPSEEVLRYIQKLFQNEPVAMKLLYRGTKQANPGIFFLTSVLVPPIKFRPAAKLGDSVHENIQNELLTRILSASNQIREISATIGNKAEPLSALMQSQLFDKLINTSVALQHSVNSLIDSNRNPDPVGQNRELPPGIKQVLEKKEGLFRKHMMGKRVNHAARSVISPDPNIETSEIGVPPVFAKKLTYPEPVTAHNYAQMRQAVINGVHIYPGATHVQNEDGLVISLLAMPVEGRTAIANQLLTPQSNPGLNLEDSRILSVNKKVFRHLRNGDLLLLNRQPTLHKPSIMAHRARILVGEKTIRMHYANCNTYNADFDGDEMNMHFPQNENARAEASLIVNTDNQYLVPTSGDPLRGLIQDHVVIAVWMTNKDTFFTKQEMQQLLYGTIRPEDDQDLDRRILTLPPVLIKPRALWSGKQIISMLLHNLKPEKMHGLNLESKSKVAGKYWGNHSEEGQIIFVDGQLLTGILDKSQFGASAYGMVHSVYELYGAESAGKLLSMLGRLFTKYAQMRAFTCRMDDLRLNEDGNSWRRKLLENGRLAGTEASSAYVGLQTVDENSEQLRTRLEEVLRDDEKLQGLDAAMKGKMNKLTSSIIDQCIPNGLLRQFPDNHMQTMTVSGAKGSNVNVSQISCLLGQQELEGRRVPIMVSGKTLPSFKPFDSGAKAGGFIAGRFLTGIKPQEYYFHCMAGREGLIDTAVKTSRSGYLQRCLIKHLEGIKVAYDSTVRDSDGSVIQMNYGEDSLDVIKSKHLHQFSFSAANFHSIKEKLNIQQLLESGIVSLRRSGAKHMNKTLKKPHKYDPALSTHNATRQVGIVSESFHEDLEKYITSNPDNLLTSQDSVSENGEGNQLDANQFRTLMHLRYQMSLVEPGEAVGILASQSVGEPSTQMTLNTFHFAGFGAKNVTLGIPRLREIIMTASTAIKTPTMTMKILPTVIDSDAETFAKDRTRVTLAQVIESVEVKERLEFKKSSESKCYDIKFNLFTSAEYNAEFNISREELETVFASRFTRALKVCVIKEIKKAGGKVPKSEKDVPEIGKAIPQSKKTQDFDDNIAHEAGINDEEGEDGDATDARIHDRAKMKTSYEKPDEEEEAIRKAALSDSEMDDDSLSIDLHSEAENGSVRDGEGREEYQGRKAEEAKSLVKKTDMLRLAKLGYDNVRKFEMSKDGEHCTISLQYPMNIPKLLMVNLVETAANMTVVQEMPGILRCFRMPSEGLDESRLLATEGVNFKAFWETDDVISHNDLYSNDIAAIGATYGVEAMRQAIIKEVSGVFAVYGIGVNRRHLSLIADYMTFEGGYKPFNRMGIESNASPFLKMTYETTCTFLTQAALHGDADTLDTPSSKIVMGKLADLGTGSFDIMQPLSVEA